MPYKRKVKLHPMKMAKYEQAGCLSLLHDVKNCWRLEQESKTLGWFCVWAANHFVEAQTHQIELQESNVSRGASHAWRASSPFKHATAAVPQDFKIIFKKSITADATGAVKHVTHDISSHFSSLAFGLSVVSGKRNNSKLISIIPSTYMCLIRF